LRDGLLLGGDKKVEAMPGKFLSECVSDSTGSAGDYGERFGVGMSHIMISLVEAKCT
jgi:hypothetical protein